MITHMLSPFMLFPGIWCIQSIHKGLFHNAWFPKKERATESPRFLISFSFTQTFSWSAFSRLTWAGHSLNSSPKGAFGTTSRLSRCVRIIKVDVCPRNTRKHNMLILIKQIRDDSVTKAASEDRQRAKWQRQEGEPERQQPDKKSTEGQSKWAWMMSYLWYLIAMKHSLSYHFGFARIQFVCVCVCVSESFTGEGSVTPSPPLFIYNLHSENHRRPEWPCVLWYRWGRKMDEAT